MLEILYELFGSLPRQGPGLFDSTKQAVSSVTLNKDSNCKILDVGCGVGKQTFDLALLTEAQILAVDNFKLFIDKVNDKANKLELSNRVKAEVQDMMNLPYPDSFFDIIWSEGAIYNIGFEKGLREWKRLLKPAGFIAVSELSWLTPTRPEEIQNYFNEEYPAIQENHDNLNIIEKLDYKIIDHFILPKTAWQEGLYVPLQNQLQKFREKYIDNQKAQAFLDTIQQEIDMYSKYSDYYGYIFYISANAK